MSNLTREGLLRNDTEIFEHENATLELEVSTTRLPQRGEVVCRGEEERKRQQKTFYTPLRSHVQILPRTKPLQNLAVCTQSSGRRICDVSIDII